MTRVAIPLLLSRRPRIALTIDAGIVGTLAAIMPARRAATSSPLEAGAYE